MKLTPEDIKRLAKLTLATRPEELSCEDWLHAVGEYVERDRDGVAPCERMQAVARHAELCPECADELEALKELARQDELD